MQQSIDRHQARPNKLTTLGTSVFLEGFSWSLDIFYFQASAICQFLFCVDSLLVSKDMPGRKLHVTFDAINCWISKSSYVRTEDSVNTERDISYRRTIIERKWNVNFFLTPTVCILVYVGFSCTSVCLYKHHSPIYTHHHSTVIFTLYM